MSTKPMSKEELIENQIATASNALLVLKQHIPMKTADTIEVKNLLYKLFKLEKRLKTIEYYGGYEKKTPKNQELRYEQ